MIDDFPRIAAEKCVELIRLTPNLSDEVGCALIHFISRAVCTFSSRSSSL